ncbi:MAG: hypothetical protein ACYC99_16010 [Candidatus Geothermincolia bacterium]
MNECAKHPDQDTMVPCLGCGRSFCRLCESPRGAGQYCPACYKEQIDALSAKSDREAGAEGPRAGKKGKPAKAIRPSGKGRLAGSVKSAGAPFIWIGAMFKSAGRRIGDAGVYLYGQPKKIGVFLLARTRLVAVESRDHFPVGLAQREILEGNPPFKEKWPRLLAVVAAGLVIWTLLVALSGVRNPGFSIGVAVLVAAGVVWALGTKFGVTVAIVATGLVLVTLVMGELLVQLLYRAHVIKKLDLQIAGLVSLNHPSIYYKTFMFTLIVERLLPSAAIAFLIGWWPLKRRLAWAGFRGRSHEERMPRTPRREKVTATRGRDTAYRGSSQRARTVRKVKPAGAERVEKADLVTPETGETTGQALGAGHPPE